MPAVLGVAALLSAAVFWVSIQSSVRFTLWSTVAEWQPTKPESRRLAECATAPGWWAWLKVVAKDRRVECGEAWVAQALAQKVRGDDRARWLQEWVVAPDSSPLRRFRSALALAVSGHPTPLEPAWLSMHPELPDLPAPGLASAVAQEAPWGVHLGPRWMALGKVWALSVSGQPSADAVPALEALWALGDPDVGREAVSAVARGLDAPPDLLQDVSYRRRRGLHAGTLPSDWVRALGRRPTCEEPCLELWIDLLRLDADASNQDPIDDPPTVPVLEPLSGALGYTGTQARALSWWVDATVDWVTASPEPAQRLASLGLGSDSGIADPVAVVWERGGSRWTTVAVIAEVGRRAGLDVNVRANELGAVQVQIGDAELTRPGCDGEVPGSWTGMPWGRASIHAAALAEAAMQASRGEQGDEAARLAVAAQRLDPVLTEAVLDTLRAGDSDAASARAHGVAVGAALAALGTVEPDAGAQESRAMVGTSLARGCAE